MTLEAKPRVRGILSTLGLVCALTGAAWASTQDTVGGSMRQGARARALARSEQLVGAQVVNEAGVPLAELHDLILDRDSGRILLGVIRVLVQEENRAEPDRAASKPDRAAAAVEPRLTTIPFTVLKWQARSENFLTNMNTNDFLDRSLIDFEAWKRFVKGDERVTTVVGLEWDDSRVLLQHVARGVLLARGEVLGDPDALILDTERGRLHSVAIQLTRESGQTAHKEWTPIPWGAVQLAIVLEPKGEPKDSKVSGQKPGQPPSTTEPDSDRPMALRFQLQIDRTLEAMKQAPRSSKADIGALVDEAFKQRWMRFYGLAHDSIP